MLIIKASIRAAPIGRATKKVHTSSDVLYPELPFRTYMLIFEFVAKKKTGTFGRREDLLFGLHLFWGHASDFINRPRVPMNRKVGKP